MQMTGMKYEWLCAWASGPDRTGLQSMFLHSGAVCPGNDTSTSEGPCSH